MSVISSSRGFVPVVLVSPIVQAVKEGLYGRTTAARLAAMRTLFVVAAQPFVEIGLQPLDALVDLLSKRDPMNPSSTVRWKRSQMPFVCGFLAFVFVWSMSLTAT